METRTYSFVYGVAKAGAGPDSEVTRVIVRRALDVWFIGKDVKQYAPTLEGTVWLSDTSNELSNSSCEREDGYVRPEFPSDLTGSSAFDPTTDPYDRSDPLLGPEAAPGGVTTTVECRSTSRI